MPSHGWDSVEARFLVWVCRTPLQLAVSHEAPAGVTCPLVPVPPNLHTNGFTSIGVSQYMWAQWYS
eukprot:5086749-Amphidinium_carterae.1